MKPWGWFLSVLGAALLAGPVMAQASSGDRELVILHTNDLQSRLLGFAPNRDYTPLTTNDDEFTESIVLQLPLSQSRQVVTLPDGVEPARFDLGGRANRRRTH